MEKIFSAKSRMRLVLSGTIISFSILTALAATDAGLTLGVPAYTNGQWQLSLTGEPGVSYVVESSSDFRSWTKVATNSDMATVRNILVDGSADSGFYRAFRHRRPLYGALVALGTIDMKGNGIATDSYDSSDPNYSTNGLYISTRRKANGDVVVNNQITNSTFNIGNAKIAGHVRTTPGGACSFGPQGTVGSLDWIETSRGIQPGYFDDDVNLYFSDVVLPSVTWNVAFGDGTGGSGTAPDGNIYDHIFTSPFDSVFNPGYYTITDQGSIYVGTNVSVRLNITTSSYQPSAIFVAGVNPNEAGSLWGYLNATNVTLNSNIRAQSGKAHDLAFFGLPSCTSIGFVSNGNFTGSIFAPAATVSLLGGGSSSNDFCGSLVAKNIQVSGHVNVHFDEALRTLSTD